MLQIDPVQFIQQVVVLAVWVLIVAAVYSVVEKRIDADAPENKNNP